MLELFVAQIGLNFCFHFEVQLSIVISTQLISNNRLSRSKIWSLYKNGNLTTDNTILWKRAEIASKEEFLLFSTIFSVYLTSGVKLHIHL